MSTALEALELLRQQTPLVNGLVRDAVASMFQSMTPDMVVNRLKDFERFLLRFCRDSQGKGVSIDELVVMEPAIVVERFFAHIVKDKKGKGGCNGHGGGGCGCNQCFSYAVQIQMAIYQRCKQILDPCDLKATNDAAVALAYPLIEDDLTRREMTFVPVVPPIVGAGYNALGQPTTYVADFSGGGVGANESVVVEQDRSFNLHWRPGCMDPSILFSDNADKESSFWFLRFTFWVARRNVTLTAADFALQKIVKKWNKWQVIEGKAFYCGESCHKEAIEGPSGCAGEDPIGREARLLVQIDNIQGANEAMTEGSTIKIDFAGRIKPCCDVCGITGGSKHHQGCCNFVDVVPQ